MSSLPNKPKIVCLTGGIGSGKSTVAAMFADLGIAVYRADDAAKKLMQEDQALKRALMDLLGANTFDDKGLLNRSWIAQRLFNDSGLLDQWNDLVHPRVSDDFKQWLNRQTGHYIIKEVAILFETGGQRHCDLSVLVTAPVNERIKRVMKRDSWTQEQVQERLKHQWTDDRKIPLADFVIENLDLSLVSAEVSKLHVLLSR